MRARYFAPVCRTDACREDPHAQWRDMVAATFNREIYLFAVKTTAEQDRRMVEELNRQPNVNHYQGFTNNCADFSRRLLNSYFPNATRRDYLNDFGMSSPKAIARSYAHYGDRHPELQRYVVRFPQVPSTLRRSGTPRNGTEVAFHLKKWLLPLAYFHYYALGVFVLDYNLTARFNSAHDLARHASPDITALGYEHRAAEKAGNRDRVIATATKIEAERNRILGSDAEWAAYRERYGDIREDAIAAGVVPNEKAIGRVMSELDKHGDASVDGQGSVWLEMDEDGAHKRLGTDRRTILAEGSDAELAYKLMLARVAAELHAKPNHREPIADFRDDWAILSTLHNRQMALSSSPQDGFGGTGSMQ